MRGGVDYNCTYIENQLWLQRKVVENGEALDKHNESQHVARAALESELFLAFLAQGQDVM